MLNNPVYECEFSDGTITEYAANIIAENIFLEAGAYGHRDIIMTGITDHKQYGTAVPKSQKYMKTRSGEKRLRQTTIGWKLLVQWNDGSKQWI